MIRPCILLDVDGVLLDFTTPFSKWFERYLAAQYGFSIDANPTLFCFDERLEKPKLSAMVHNFIATGPTLPMIDPSIPTVLARLRKRFAIHLITAWPHEFAQARIDTLLKHGIYYDSIQFIQNECDSDAKLKAVQLLKPLCLVEDKPATIELVSEAGYKVFAPSRQNYVANATFPKTVSLYSTWADFEIKLETF